MLFCHSDIFLFYVFYSSARKFSFTRGSNIELFIHIDRDMIRNKTAASRRNPTRVELVSRKKIKSNTTIARRKFCFKYVPTVTEETVDWTIGDFGLFQCSSGIFFQQCRVWCQFIHVMFTFCVHEADIEHRIINEPNQFISSKYGHVQLLVTLLFFGGATSLCPFLKANRTSETKSFF